MSYVPPAPDAIHFEFDGAYSPPPAGAIDFAFAPPTPAEPVYERRRIMVVLVRLTIGATVWYFSDAAYYDAENDICYDPRLFGSIRWRRGVSCILWSGRDTADSGLGVIEVINDDAALDELAQQRGRVEVSLVDQWMPVSSEQLVGTATALIEARGERRIRIVSQSVLRLLDAPFQPALYADTDVHDSPSALVGRPRPVAIGEPLSCPIVLVDEVDYEYDVHEAAGWAVSVVRDNGKQLSTPAGYVTSGTTGVFGIELQARPVGRVVADVTMGSTLLADAIEALFDRAADQGVEVDYDTVSLSALGTTCPYPVSYWADSSETHGEVLQHLLDSVIGWAFADPSGTVRFGRLHRPTGGSPVLVIDEVMIAGDIDIEPDLLDNLSTTVAGARNWYRHEPSELADALTDSERAALTADYRIRKTATAAISDELGTRTGARVRPRNATSDVANSVSGRPASAVGLGTALDDSADVQAVADYIAALVPEGSRMRLLKVPVFIDQGAESLLPGDEVELRFPRWGCTTGRPFVFIDIAGSAGDQQFDIWIWGDLAVEP